jgi:hypothetical protein
MTTDTLDPPIIINPVPRSPQDALLGLLAEFLGDFEDLRIRQENRLRQLTRSVEDSDGEERGFGLDESHPTVALVSAIVAKLVEVEADATKALEKATKAHPFGPWIAHMKGVGLKQGGRLLGAIGDPYWHPLYDRPRMPSELWSYTGYGVWRTDADGEINPQAPGDFGIAPHRRKGHKSNWSDAGKMRVYLVSTACIKQLDRECKEFGRNKHLPGCGCSPYRIVYDATRVKYENALHRTPCKRCGPSGKPAEVGSPLSDGHKHGIATRAVSKAILLALWLEGQRLREEREHG